jgi:cell division protein FtsZ
MSDELRVTVVVTGLGRAADSNAGKATNTAVSSRHDGALDYQKLDRPTVLRKQNTNTKPAAEPMQDIEYLDIPAFLRRQEEA